MQPNPSVKPKPNVKHDHKQCIVLGKYHYHMTSGDYRYAAGDRLAKGRSATLVGR